VIFVSVRDLLACGRYHIIHMVENRENMGTAVWAYAFEGEKSLGPVGTFFSRIIPILCEIIRAEAQSFQGPSGWICYFISTQTCKIYDSTRGLIFGLILGSGEMPMLLLLWGGAFRKYSRATC